MEQRRWLVLALALLLAFPLSENFVLTSPQKVLGIVGEDTILPCTISSKKPLDNPQVQWIKVTDGHTENIYTYGQHGGESAKKYHGRTSMPGDGFATGNVSLTLKSVQPADEGIYSCTLISREWSAETVIKLSIAGTGEMFIEILGPQGQGFELGCRSHGWFPEPTVQWVTEDGPGLFAATEIHQDSEKLFSVWSRVTVTGQQVRKITCEILNPLVQVEKKTTALASGAVFPRISHFVPAFWTLLALFLLTLVAAAFLAYRGYKKLQDYKGRVRAAFYKERVTLDADTAHPRLEISENGKRVRDTGVMKCVRSNEKRFDSHLIVLAKQGYTTGKHFWEVHVGKRKSWVVGIALESVTRKGTFTLSPQNGFWAVGLADGGDYWAYTDPWTRLHVYGESEVNEVRIFLDIPAKRVSFYAFNVSGFRHSFSIPNGSSQKGKFIPFFCTGPATDSPDPYPLEIL